MLFIEGFYYCTGPVARRLETNINMRLIEYVKSGSNEIKVKDELGFGSFDILSTTRIDT